MNLDDLINRFNYHAPKDEVTKNKHAAIRGACLALAEGIVNMTPACREQSTAITKLEEVMMWANAAIARHQ